MAAKRRARGKAASKGQDHTPPPAPLDDDALLDLLPGFAPSAGPVHDDDEAAKGGRPPHAPTPATRRSVEAMSTYRIPQITIAAAIGISEPTLRKHYRQEIARGHGKSTLAVHRTLFKMAVSGKSIAATIFWTKVNSGWSEKVQHQAVDADGNPVRWAVFAPTPIASSAEWQQQFDPSPTAH